MRDDYIHLMDIIWF